MDAMSPPYPCQTNHGDRAFPIVVVVADAAAAQATTVVAVAVAAAVATAAGALVVGRPL